jgi:hypothetical protein
MGVRIDEEKRSARLPFLVELTTLCVRARYPDPNWVETLRELAGARRRRGCSARPRRSSDGSKRR